MTIENSLERIASALEALAAMHASTAVDTSDAPAPTPKPRGRKPAAPATDSAPLTQTPSTSAAASAPAGGAQASAGQGASSGLVKLTENELKAKQNIATEAIVALADKADRALAVGILAKGRTSQAGKAYPGVKRCSDLEPEFLDTVLAEAQAALATWEAQQKVQSETDSLV